MLVLAAVFSTLAAPALADDLGLITPDDAVIDHPDLVYGDLLKQVIPDLDTDGSHWTGHLPDGIRMIDGGEPGETPETVEVSYLEVRQLDAGGQKTLWVTADIGEGGNLGTYTLLAVFDADAKLIDRAEVDTDRLTGFIGAPIRISKSDEAILIDSEHSNSDQTYQSMTLAFVHDGKLAVVDDLFAFGVSVCTYQQYEDIKVTATPASEGMWPITVTTTRYQFGKLVDPTSSEASSDCVDPEESQFKPTGFTAVYEWDAAAGKYATTSKALVTLELADQNLF